MKNESIINDEIHYKIINQRKKHPDPKLHQSVSFLKSAVRISGYVALFWSVGLGAVILILSEIIGIVEELV
jgi:hypothetical protein